jgi:hypothetical protein
MPSNGLQNSEAQSDYGARLLRIPLQFVADSVFEIVLCRLPWELSLWDSAEMVRLRGFGLTDEAVPNWAVLPVPGH